MRELTIDGRLLSFPAVWLRDNCLCPDCAPGTAQKINDITDMPNGVAITRTGHADDTEPARATWLQAAGQGGETGLVDGFAAAAALRAADPASFGTLTGTAAPFGYVDKEAELRACQPRRHLQGCYADLDGLASTVAVLRRAEGI